MSNYSIYGILEDKKDILCPRREDHIGHTKEVTLPSNNEIAKPLFSTKENSYFIEVVIKSKTYEMKIISVNIDPVNEGRAEIIGLLKTSEKRVSISTWP